MDRKIEEKLKETKKLYTIDQGDVDVGAIESGFVFRRRWHEEKISSFLRELPGGKLLDVACGSGALTFKIAEKIPSMQVFGADFNEEAIEYAKKEAKKQKKRIEFVASPAEKMPFSSNEFDSILLSDALDHFVEPKMALNEMNRMLKKNGKIILTVGNYHSLFPVVEIMWNLFSSERKWDKQHLTHFNEKKLRQFLQEAGFNGIKITTIHNSRPFFYWIANCGVPFLEGFMEKHNLGMTHLAIAKKK